MKQDREANRIQKEAEISNAIATRVKKMELDELKAEADKFFEWSSDKKDHVTLTSALIFAQVMMQKERDNLKKPASCEISCEKTAFNNSEIKRLKAKIDDADYLIGAFERGCDSDDSGLDIAEYKSA